MNDWDFGIEFQYLPAGHKRPIDQPKDDKIRFKRTEFFPIPDVGDTVFYKECDQEVCRKVLTRHFAWILGRCLIYIVVGDVSDDEMSKRLKQ